ncbi:hypothetical protein [Chondromyces apiculatus]|uniref:hypothetical protein n=1 Tax=Chondromyces apiculatus TaxID=51 RepID=UPI0018CC417E|nr:hypothetical protein [Chondromyces apiculatus]
MLAGTLATIGGVVEPAGAAAAPRRADAGLPVDGGAAGEAGALGEGPGQGAEASRGVAGGTEGAEDAGDAGEAGEGEALATLEARVKQLEGQRDALGALLRGVLPDSGLTSGALLGVDLLDDAAVALRRGEIARDLEEMRKADQARDRTAESPDAGPLDAGVADTSDAAAPDATADGALADEPQGQARERLEHEIRRSQQALAEAQLALLDKPAWERRRIAEAEADRARSVAQQALAEAERKGAADEARAAEEARKRALAEAEQARSAAQRTLASERARAEQVRRDQAQLREELSRRRGEDAATSTARQARLFELLEAAGTAQPGTAATDALYGRIMAQLVALRPDTEAALGVATALRDGQPVPRYSLPREALPSGAGELERERQEILTLAETLADGERALIEESRRLTSARLDELLTGEQELNEARVLLLDKLSPARRDEVLGLGPEGGTQLGWEIWHVGARGRWYTLSRDDLAVRTRAAMRDPYVIGAVITRGVPVLLVLATALTLFRRRRRLRDAAWKAISSVIRRPPLLRALQRALDALEALSPELVFLAALWGVHAVLGPLSTIDEARIAHALLVWYGLYRLALKAAHRAITWLSSTPNAPIGEATSAKILRSLRLVGRYALGVQVVLSLTAAIVGEAFIHHQVRRFAWLGAIPIFFTLIRRWRGHIADAYLQLTATGSLADAVRSTRDRWYGFFVAVAAFGVILLAGASGAARRFVLGFEQSRKVLAYLFRKRLERRAEDGDEGRVTAVGLPPDLVACFSEAPLDDPAEGIDRFPGIDRFAQDLSAWRAGERLGAVLLVGSAGSGKTSWLAAAEQRAGALAAVRVLLPRRITSAGELYAQIGAALGAPQEARASVEALAAWMRTGEARLVVVDHTERLLLRGAGAWGAWDALQRLIEQASDSAFWLCTMDLYAFHYLRFARQNVGAFRTTLTLPRWSEQEIASLIHARNEQSGYAISFDDLLLEEVGGHEREARLVSTEHDYMRLLWDHADGSPRVALHFWLRSLVPDGDRKVRVRLFRSPYEDELEILDEPARFVLASVMWHGDVTPEEAERSLRYPASTCEAVLVRLAERGVLAAAERRYRVTTRWQGAVSGFLLRKHLIEP